MDNGLIKYSISIYESLILKVDLSLVDDTAVILVAVIELAVVLGFALLDVFQVEFVEEAACADADAREDH